MFREMDSRMLTGVTAGVLGLCLVASWVLLWGATGMATWGLAPYDTTPERGRAR